jgi:hypothetical protein
MHGCTAPAQLPLTTSIDPRPESRCPSDLREDVCVLRGHRRAWSTRYGIAGTARRALPRAACRCGGASLEASAAYHAKAYSCTLTAWPGR